MDIPFVPDYQYHKMITKIKLSMARVNKREDLVKEILELHRRKVKKLHNVCKQFHL